MDFLRKARDLEAKLSGTLDRTVGEFVRSGTREPIEIVHAVVEAAQAEVQSSGRGRRVFPFNTVTVTILATSRDVRARFEAVFADGPSLRDRIVAHLESSACFVDHLDVVVNYDTRPRKGWRDPNFDIEFDRVDRAQGQVPSNGSTPLRVDVTVLNGTAERRSYALTAMRIDIGRCAEVRDSRHRLIRTNHVAFLERSGEVNQSVSRRHAHICTSRSPDRSGCMMMAASTGPASFDRGGVSRFRGERAASASNRRTRSSLGTHGCASSSVRKPAGAE